MSEGLIILYVLIVWVAVITAVGLAHRWTHGAPSSEEVELEELRARYARAEMSHEEYERRRSQLSSRSSRHRADDQRG